MSAQPGDQVLRGAEPGGGSLIEAPREEWEKTFAVCWYGVYYGTRTFLPMLLASEEGHLVNTSSVNGFWDSLGPLSAHTAYSAAKFAVKGFTEALINDLRLHAPHVKVSLVKPGHIGTSIIMNFARMLGNDPKEMSDEKLAEARERLTRMGWPLQGRRTSRSPVARAVRRALPRRRADERGGRREGDPRWCPRGALADSG